MRVESLELRDSCEVERVEVCNTMREVTVITVQLNEVGDTLKQTIITDRTHSSTRDRTQVRLTTEKQKVLHDTVYVERESDKQVTVAAGPNVEIDKEGNVTRHVNRLAQSLKWLCFAALALALLILVIRIFLKR